MEEKTLKIYQYLKTIKSKYSTNSLLAIFLLKYNLRNTDINITLNKKLDKPYKNFKKELEREE